MNAEHSRNLGPKCRTTLIERCPPLWLSLANPGSIPLSPALHPRWVGLASTVAVKISRREINYRVG
jgi:hypothetical protein